MQTIFGHILNQTRTHYHFQCVSRLEPGDPQPWGPPRLIPKRFVRRRVTRYGFDGLLVPSWVIKRIIALNRGRNPMPRLHVLSDAAAEAWDTWKDQSKKANTANKNATRAKEEFEAEFGDRELAALPDGRQIQRIREGRDGYTVGPKTITRYILKA